MSWHRFFFNGSKSKVTKEKLNSYWLISFNWKIVIGHISSIVVTGCSNYEHFTDLPRYIKIYFPIFATITNDNKINHQDIYSQIISIPTCSSKENKNKTFFYLRWFPGKQRFMLSNNCKKRDRPCDWKTGKEAARSILRWSKAYAAICIITKPIKRGISLAMPKYHSIIPIHSLPLSYSRN